jgi:hypothetical protein
MHLISVKINKDNTLGGETRLVLTKCCIQHGQFQPQKHRKVRKHGLMMSYQMRMITPPLRIKFHQTQQNSITEAPPKTSVIDGMEQNVLEDILRYVILFLSQKSSSKHATYTHY